MWIMLIKKLPTNPSPPKLSIFWSELWFDYDIVSAQFRRYFSFEDLGIFVKGTKRKPVFLNEDGHEIDASIIPDAIVAYMSEQSDILTMPFGSEDNWARARSIFYKGEKIRVFPREYSILNDQKMSLYLGMSGQDGSHELVPEGIASEKILHHDLVEGTPKEVYDAALVDGANHYQAQFMALGIVVDAPSESYQTEFPKLGWYRCRKEYASYYCDEREMEE